MSAGLERDLAGILNAHEIDRVRESLRKEKEAEARAELDSKVSALALPDLTADQERRLLVSEVRVKLSQSIPMIKTLVALCPLLGLLGTVTGMIEVFDVMAIAGGGNPRAMAAGVSKATIPTMAGMVAALSGLALSVKLERFAREETKRVEDHLTHD